MLAVRFALFSQPISLGLWCVWYILQSVLDCPCQNSSAFGCSCFPFFWPIFRCSFFSSLLGLWAFFCVLLAQWKGEGMNLTSSSFTWIRVRLILLMLLYLCFFFFFFFVSAVCYVNCITSKSYYAYLIRCATNFICVAHFSRVVFVVGVAAVVVCLLLLAKKHVYRRSKNST